MASLIVAPEAEDDIFDRHRPLLHVEGPFSGLQMEEAGGHSGSKRIV